MGPIKFLWAYGWNTLYVLAKGRNTCSKRQTRPYQQQGDRQGDDGSEGERSHIYDVCMEEAIERINPVRNFKEGGCNDTRGVCREGDRRSHMLHAIQQEHRDKTREQRVEWTAYVEVKSRKERYAGENKADQQDGKGELQGDIFIPRSETGEILDSTGLYLFFLSHRSIVAISSPS